MTIQLSHSKRLNPSRRNRFSIVLGALLCAPLFLTACKDDDEEQVTSADRPIILAHRGAIRIYWLCISLKFLKNAKRPVWHFTLVKSFDKSFKIQNSAILAKNLSIDLLY